MQCPDQEASHVREPNVSPFSASRRCYPGNLGQGHWISVILPVPLSILFDRPVTFDSSRRSDQRLQHDGHVLGLAAASRHPG